MLVVGDICRNLLFSVSPTASSKFAEKKHTVLCSATGLITRNCAMIRSPPAFPRFFLDTCALSIYEDRDNFRGQDQIRLEQVMKSTRWSDGHDNGHNDGNCKVPTHYPLLTMRHRRMCILKCNTEYIMLGQELGRFLLLSLYPEPFEVELRVSTCNRIRSRSVGSIVPRKFFVF